MASADHAFPTPISLVDVQAAVCRLQPHLERSPVRTYATLDAYVGHGIQVAVKHENLLPTNAFKVRNAFSLLTALAPAEAARGVVAATRGNHGLGLAWAGKTLGIAVTICVPRGNNPEKNAAIAGLGATLIEDGEDYDAAALVAADLVRTRGLTLAHSTNNALIIAGAATLTYELAQQEPQLDAMVVAVGGGSQAVGAIVVARALMPKVEIYGVQAQGANAAYLSWHQKTRVTTASAQTMADGLATRATYDTTWPTLAAGLAGFVAVSEADLAAATRALWSTTHTMVEPAGAAGLAGLMALRTPLRGKRVAIVASGGNIDAATLRLVACSE